MPKRPETKPSEFQLVTQFFRRTLKDRGLSYKDFAEQLGISESGLKKILNGDDTSYQRLSQMAQALNLRLSEVFQAIDKPRTSATQFTPEQQQYFLKNMDVFHFFFRLVIERATPQQIGKEEGLKESEVFSYLRKLDQLKIIQLLPGDNLVLPPLVPVLDFGGGPLLEKIYREWTLEMTNELAHPEKQKDGHFIVRYTKMSDETYKEFITRLRELEIEFLRRGIREMRVGAQKLKGWRWISMTDQSSYVKKVR